MHIFRLTVVLAALSPAMAAAGEYHMISRQSDGTFSSSHRVFDRNGSTLHEIALCGRPYFARAATVAWMNYEAEEGRDVGLEYNGGSGWFRVCEDPDQQVKLADIGVKDDNLTVMRASDAATNKRQRFINIKKAFSSFSNSGRTTPSFHGR
ncbi:hypothetical protein [Stappia stellulata]|uniref:hypothetical protein n=1 Tax=Stappia stellulata TaxID=71235 RepID=UPI00040C6C92|nr:hypothetical protein [Stappia stellulata]